LQTVNFGVCIGYVCVWIGDVYAWIGDVCVWIGDLVAWIGDAVLSVTRFKDHSERSAVYKAKKGFYCVRSRRISLSLSIDHSRAFFPLLARITSTVTQWTLVLGEFVAGQFVAGQFVANM
jgi:hypothetical protein